MLFKKLHTASLKAYTCLFSTPPENFSCVVSGTVNMTCGDFLVVLQLGSYDEVWNVLARKSFVLVLAALAGRTHHSAAAEYLQHIKLFIFILSLCSHFVSLGMRRRVCQWLRNQELPASQAGRCSGVHSIIQRDNNPRTIFTATSKPHIDFSLQHSSSCNNSLSHSMRRTSFGQETFRW